MRLFTRIFRQIWGWFKTFKFYKRSYHFKGYNIRTVRDLPDVLNDDEILILDEDACPELIALKCPCGCNANIHLNLLSDTSPKWKFTIDKSEITVKPSVWKKDGCKSHFFIISNKIKWV